MNNKDSRDVLIVGSGIGGLSSAIILLKLGYNVTVVEKNSEPGGLMRSYNRQGIECPVGVHYLGSLNTGEPLRKLFDYLGVTSQIPVERMGVNGVIDRYIFDDFTFDLPEGIDAYGENLNVAFPGENKQISAIIAGIKKLAPLMQSLSFLFREDENHSIFSSLDFFNSMGEMLSRLNCSKDLRSVLEVPCSWIGLPLADCPMFYHHNVLLSYLFSSWRLKCSGSAMADVFASRVRELGGEIITGDEVDKISVKDREAEGLALKSGRMLKAKIIIAAIHPKTMIQLLQEGSVKPSYAKRISQIEDTFGVFSASLAIDAEAHEELPYNIFRLSTNPDGSLSRGVFCQLRKSEKAGTNILTIMSDGKFREWQKWEDTKSGKRGGEYLHKKEEETEELLKTASGVFGHLKEAKLLDAYTPLTIRDWVNSPNGSAYGVMRSNSQLLKTAALNRTSVRGLYLAGQSVLAPGILGTVLGSFITVKDIVGNEVFKKESI